MRARVMRWWNGMSNDDKIVTVCGMVLWSLAAFVLGYLILGRA